MKWIIGIVIALLVIIVALSMFGGDDANTQATDTSGGSESEGANEEAELFDSEVLDEDEELDLGSLIE